MLSGDGISYSLIGVCTIYKGANNLGASVDAPQSVQIELFIKEYLFPSEYNRPLVLPFLQTKAHWDMFSRRNNLDSDVLRWDNNT